MMDEKMRKAMSDSARRICHTMLRDMISRGTAEKYCHEMFSYGEMDAELYKYFGRPASHAELLPAVHICKWQFEADKSRIALAEQLRDSAYDCSERDQRHRLTLCDKICMLEAKLSAAEDEIVRLDKNNALLETRLRRLPDGPRR